MKKLRNYLWLLGHGLSLAALFVAMGYRLYLRTEPSRLELEVLVLGLLIVAVFSYAKLRQIEKWTKGVGE